MKGFGVVEEDAAAVVIAFAACDPASELVDAADCACADGAEDAFRVGFPVECVPQAATPQFVEFCCCCVGCDWCNVVVFMVQDCV